MKIGIIKTLTTYGEPPMIRIIPVSGNIDEKNNIGYHYNDREEKWIATDIATGLSVAKSKTFTDCVNTIKTSMDKIDKKRKAKGYQEKVDRLKRLEETKEENL